MISVVSAKEASKALQGGAEILDVKNPSEGSLGAPSPETIQEIKKLAAGKVKISAALGDLPNLPGTAALAAFGAAFAGADYVKAGLYGPRNETDAIALLREAKNALRQFGCSIIAAGYADYHRVGTLRPEQLLQAAVSAGVQGLLLDTFIKDGQGLFNFLNPQEIKHLVERAHAEGLVLGLAGALQERDLPVIRNLGADVVGLRTAVCRNHQRNGALEAALVRRLLNLTKIS
jgi:(5-formylfuran-3-yl)methyl phosphate synthase